MTRIILRLAKVPARFRGLVGRVGIVALGLLIASPASAQDGTLDTLEVAFTRWMKQYGVARATLAVAHRERLVLAKGYGGLGGEQRVLIASLAKPITGVCVAMLIQQGRLHFDSSLGEWLPRHYGEPRDPRLLKVTVAQLLTHRAGFSRREDDPATGSALSEVLRRRGPGHGTMHDLVPTVLRAKLDHEPGTVYAYTNAGHLLLGVLIEAVTGQTYEAACSAAVLVPQGIKGARLDSTRGVLGSFGGWSLSGPEYLAFLRTLAPTGTLLAPDTRQWMLSPAGKETTATGRVFYSFMLVRPQAAGGQDFLHAGDLIYRFPDKRVDENVRTLAVIAAFGASWFVYYERAGSDAAIALSRDMYRAGQSVTTWPETNLYPVFNLP
jgi:CubicO group peptidase (beta-lactamase class C family)